MHVFYAAEQLCSGERDEKHSALTKRHKVFINVRSLYYPAREGSEQRRVIEMALGMGITSSPLKDSVVSIPEQWEGHGPKTGQSAVGRRQYRAKTCPFVTGAVPNNVCSLGIKFVSVCAYILVQGSCVFAVAVAYTIRQHMKLDLEIFLSNQSSFLLLPIFVLLVIGYRRLWCPVGNCRTLTV